MEGGHDPDCRRCMPWSEIAAGNYDKRIAKIKELIALRKKYPAAGGSKISWIKDEPRMLCYKKEKAGEKSILVSINATGTACPVAAEGELLFSYGYENHMLLADGVCIVALP